MVSIAREIMLQDKVRFAITVISLGFAIVMIVYDMGMFFGTISIVTHDNRIMDMADRVLYLDDGVITEYSAG